MHKLKVENRWFELTSHLFTDETADILWNQLEDLYEESHRAYHNFEHIADCFSKLDRAADLIGNRLMLELAIFYHDVIYDPKAQKGQNEQDSADFAAEVLGRAGLPNSEIAIIYQLILDTQHQAISKSADGRLLVDIDLTILGAEKERFDRYEKEIRAEYSWVEEQAYRMGRAQLMQSFLNRERLFETRYFFDRYEDKARQNLQRLIDQLSVN